MTPELELATSLAKQAGEIMRTNFALGMKREWKADNTPLTESDIAINALVVQSVAEKFPDHGVVGEEESSQHTQTEYTWVCDPIDGTIPFSRGTPLSTFSLALCRDGDPILGVIYDPFMDRLLTAEKGKGAFLNGKSISVSSSTELKSTAMNVESWRSQKYDVPNISATLGELGVKVQKFSAFVYGGMLVACGEFSGAIFSGSTPWDVAAVKIIVEEAGGKVTNLAGSEQRYDQPLTGALVSNGHLHTQLQELIASHQKAA